MITIRYLEIMESEDEIQYDIMRSTLIQSCHLFSDFLLDGEDDDDMVNYVIDTSSKLSLKAVYGGSRPNRKPNKPRIFEAAHNKIYEDYFQETPVYNESDFNRRFRMTKELFKRIMDRLPSHDNFFEQKEDAVGKLEASTLQKCVATYMS